MVGLGCTNKDSSTLNNLYFFRANTSDITTNSTSITDKIKSATGQSVSESDFDTALDQAQKELNIKDFYTIGLWGYCDGNITSSNSFDTTHCSQAKAEFYFDPISVWNLNGTGLESELPDGLDKALKVYKGVSKWMFIAYIIAFVATILELVVGIFAICSRWGSCVTSLVSAVAFFFTAAASVTSTALFATLTGTFNSALKQYNIHGSMGKNIYVATWLAVAFALGASLFWTISTCCCSGRSPYNNRSDNRHKGGVTAEKAPYTYEPLGANGTQAPYGPYNHGDTSYAGHAGQTVPVQSNRTNAYEPFRHV
ncbi:hypothetical protein ASPWEDRAFT_40815 [Aspergillus wentii DTO 134E9]|uniref:Uncharacterized protein n=1 Tax=Aspergillus wentii DTO 134E9 TaxID=1073089 RepID=A0A1L9RKZ2_ASPWE|nr:uncharacterized protein ASPWEDRAFT_40815 [Aspergillus wentii DTO 134E9]OJJ35605.1 hypothetical protein ASPWEDRAFT_40815 [Aspergillus wentii DTO 134E9]